MGCGLIVQAGPPFTSFLTYRLWQVVETAPGGTLPLFSLITHTRPLEMFGKCHTKCRTRLFLARSRSFALISCFSASPLFLFPPHFMPHYSKSCSPNINFPFAAFPLPGRFPAPGGLRGTAQGCPRAREPQRAHLGLQEKWRWHLHRGPPRPASPPSPTPARPLPPGLLPAPADPPARR